jgi:NADPH:quinone reductase-like Zn-dependent oxidoreductase
MRAAVFERYGPPGDVLQVRDVAQPAPGRGEVLVRMIASPINPSDLMFIEGRYTIPAQLPATPGFEGVGIVESAGGGVLGWLRKGKRVAVIHDRLGAWAEYTITKSRLVVPVPDAIPDDQAAAFFVNPATAIAMTQDVLRIPAGQWLLQTAAGGELGKMIVRLGRRIGFRTMNVVRRREQVDELKKLGGDAVLVEADGPIDEQVKRLTDGAGVPFAIDPVGGKTGSELIASLGAGGRCLLYGSLSDEAASVHPRRLISAAIRIEGFWLGAWARKQSIPRMLRLFKQVRQMMTDGTLTSHIAAKYPLDRVAEAATHAAAPGKGGKVILVLRDS